MNWKSIPINTFNGYFSWICTTHFSKLPFWTQHHIYDLIRTLDNVEFFSFAYFTDSTRRRGDAYPCVCDIALAVTSFFGIDFSWQVIVISCKYCLGDNIVFGIDFSWQVIIISCKYCLGDNIVFGIDFSWQVIVISCKYCLSDGIFFSIDAVLAQNAKTYYLIIKCTVVL